MTTKSESRIFYLIATLLIMNSCSFNKLFLQPEKPPVLAKKLTLAGENDTTVIYFTGINYQPTFTKNGRDTFNLDYTIESFTFKSKNGNNLNGWLLKPKNLYPTITLLHFHGNAGFLVSQYQAISPLLKNGFQIFMFDYSGFGFSEGKATRKNVLIDALSALDYIKTRKELNNTKLVIYGQSLGGHLAAVVAAQRQNDIDALVIEAAFSSYKDISAYKVPILGRIFTKQGYNATKSIKSFHKPTLIIHSTEDRVIPFFMGHKIFNYANQPKEFFKIKKCHICAPYYYTNEISEKIKNMFSQNKN